MDTSKKVHGHGNFVPGSVRIVDYDVTTNNVLVRGSSAFGATGFEMSQLTAAIAADVNYRELVAAGIGIASNPLIIDFCLIGYAPDSKDSRIVSAETTWFSATPPALNGGSGPYPVYIPATVTGNTGVMVYWPVLAIGGVAPATAGGAWPVSPAVSINSGTTNFNYAGLIPAVRNALTNNTSALPAGFPSGTSIKNAIIYFHCDSGVNRTGSVAASYLMQYGSNLSVFNLASAPTAPYTLKQAQTAANLAPPSNDSTPAGGCDIPVTEAYCNYLSTGNCDSALAAACVPVPGTTGTGG